MGRIVVEIWHSEISGETRPMTNEERAEELIKHYGFDFESISKDEIRGLIEQSLVTTMRWIT